MFKHFAHAALVAALLLSSTAHAQQQKDPIDCIKVNKDGGDQYEMDVCQAREYAAADVELNKVYGKLRDVFKDDKAADALLRKAQRAWVTFRDAEGALCADNHGFSEDGSGYGMVLMSCKTDLTRQRTAVLKEHVREAQSR